MSRQKEQLFTLTKPCKACGWCLCCCLTLKHAETCTWRRYVLGLDKAETTPACNCDKAAALAKWIEREMAKYQAGRAKEANESEAA